MDTSQSSGRLREYLLGGLTEPERQEVEQRCFADDEFFLEVEAAEQDLIDRYVRGTLRAGERARFENSFAASPARARRIEIARHLVKYIDERRPVRQPALAWWQVFPRLLASPVLKPMISAAASLLVIAGAIVFWTERKSPAPQQAQVPPPSTRPANNVSAPPGNPQTPERPALIPAFLLMPGLSRGGGGLQIVRSGGADSVRLQLVLESVDYSRYQASIETPDGRVVFSRSGLTPSSVNRSRVVVLTAPVSRLTAGDYILRLSGIEAGSSEPVSDYSFRVVRN